MNPFPEIAKKAMETTRKASAASQGVAVPRIGAVSGTSGRCEVGVGQRKASGLRCTGASQPTTITAVIDPAAMIAASTTI